MGSAQRCPICSVVVGPHARYPSYVCGACAAEACSAEGRPLAFFNVDISGGYRAEYADTREPYESHECFVRGVSCWADEARFGGIVIQAREVQTNEARTKPTRARSGHPAQAVQEGAERAQGAAARGRTPVASRDICEMLGRDGVLRTGEWLRRSPRPLDARLLPDRVRGMLLGVAIGDALGNTSESMEPAERARHFGEVRDYLPHRHAHGRAVGLPSDDTQLTFRTVEQLVEEGRLSAVGLLERFASEKIFGMGAATREAMALFRAGRLTCTGVKSAGNGGLMRVAPVLLPHLRAPSAELWADTVAATAATHADSMAIASSVAWVHLLWELLGSSSTPRPDFWLARFYEVAREVEAPGERYRPSGGAWPDFDGTLSAYLQGCAPIFERGRPARDACELWYSGAYLLETIPSVLYILSRHADDPEEALVRAVNDTWDNDSIASIVGAALGALHGASAFPSRWREGLLGRTRADDDGKVFELIEAAVDAFAVA